LFLRRPSAEERLVATFLERLRQGYGVEIDPGAGLRELTTGIEDPAVVRFVSIYSGVIYRDRRLSPEEAGELRGLIRRMKKR
jgi:hypothetical protein